MAAALLISHTLWTNRVGGVRATGQGVKLNLKEEGGEREEGGTDEAVFNEKGMCILRIFMTI